MPTQADLFLGRPTREQVGGMYLPTLLLTLFFFILVIQMNLPTASEYGFLFFVAIVTLLYVERTPGMSEAFRRHILYPENTQARHAVMPLVLGIVIVLFPFSLYAIVTASGFTTNSFGQNLPIFGTEVLAVGVVEEFYFRHVLTVTLGAIPSAILFGAAHPSVRSILFSDQFLNVGAWGYNFLYFVLFAFIFQYQVFLAQTAKPRNRRYFGLPLTIGEHGAFNTLLILWPGLTIFGLQLSPFDILGGPSPGVIGWAVLAVIAAAILAYHGIRLIVRKWNHGPTQ